jgi:putative addiction module component (TIGR02574 family)
MGWMLRGLMVSRRNIKTDHPEHDMSALLDELSKKARGLAPEERAQLAQELLESVEREADPLVQQAWETEIASRIAKYERGEATLVPAEEVFAAARRLTQ